MKLKRPDWAWRLVLIFGLLLAWITMAHGIQFKVETGLEWNVWQWALALNLLGWSFVGFWYEAIRLAIDMVREGGK